MQRHSRLNSSGLAAGVEGAEGGEQVNQTNRSEQGRKVHHRLHLQYLQQRELHGKHYPQQQSEGCQHQYLANKLPINLCR